MEPEFIVASLANTQKGRGNLAAATDTALQCVSLPIPPFPTDPVEKKNLSNANIRRTRAIGDLSSPGGRPPSNVA